jgi:hypothetical protein
VPMAMNRHRLAPFPPLYGTDVALQIGGDFLPRIEPVFPLAANGCPVCGVLRIVQRALELIAT